MNNTLRNTIEEKTFDKERALYGIKNTRVKSCTFAGPADGESALKECRDITVENCNFSLRYPVWHAEKFAIYRCRMDELTRAALWYCKDGAIYESELGGIKALRECRNVLIADCKINSPEFGWRCDRIEIHGSEAVSEYFMFESKNLVFKDVKFSGKYSFQYIKNAKIENCNFATKDAFWHSENVTVENSVLKGEYLGWYSKGLTLINCTITGTQPLCYCKGLKLINCRTEGCDLAFEYSDVTADIKGEIISIKNPKSGKITVDGVKDIICEDNNIPCKGKIIIR